MLEGSSICSGFKLQKKPDRYRYLARGWVYVFSETVSVPKIPFGLADFINELMFYLSGYLGWRRYLSSFF